MKEKQIEKKVCEYAESLGWLQYKFKSANHKGVPDRIFMRGGEVLFIEFKGTGKYPTKLQCKIRDDIEEKGIDVFIIDSVQDGKEIFSGPIVETNRRTLRDIMPNDEVGTPPLELEIKEEE